MREENQLKIVVGIATYNESLNIEGLIEEIHNHLPNQTILVVDDNSPDKTGDVVKKVMEKDGLVKLIERPGKLGLGSAHMAMMKYAIDMNFDALITMDADFSHQPKYLKNFNTLLREYDFVIGSRYIEGGKSHYGFYRSLISKSANLGAQKLAGITLKECTTAYRGFKTSLLKKIPFSKIKSNGYSFMVEMLYHVEQHTTKKIEFPIEFIDRMKGTSKINKKEMIQSIFTLLRLYKNRVTSLNKG